MRVKITDIGNMSQYFGNKKIIGSVLEVADKISECSEAPGFYHAAFLSDEIDAIYGFKYIEVPEPSQMSEVGITYGKPYCKTQIPVTQDALDQIIAAWISENMPAPKKLSWWQKLIDSFKYQKNMNKYWKESRDLWKSIAIAKAHELEVSHRVGDNWEQVAIERGKRADRYCEALETIMVTIETLFKDIANDVHP